MDGAWGGRANAVIFILPHCRGYRSSMQCLQKDLSSLSAPQNDKRLSLAAQVLSLWVAGPAPFIPWVPWQELPGQVCLHRVGPGGDNAELLGRFPTKLSCCCPGRVTLNGYSAGLTVVPLILTFLICRKRYVFLRTEL